MHRLAQLVGLLASLGLAGAACSSTVVSGDFDDDVEDGEGGDGGQGGYPSTGAECGTMCNPGPTTGMDPLPPSPAISMLQWELDTPPSATSSGVSVSSSGGNFTTVGVTSSGVTTGSGPTTSVSSGIPHDYDTLVILLSNQPQACEDPFATDCTSLSWQISIRLPTEIQAVGTYALTGLASFYESDSCNGGGGGSFWEGTIQVTNIDDTQVDFILSGTSDFFFSPGNADGTYSAPRCF